MSRARIRVVAKNKVRAILRRTRLAIVRTFFSYSREELISALRRVGVKPGDSVMLHSAFDRHHGFNGSVQDVIDAFIASLGPQGNLLMVSMPYQTSSLEYLSKIESFDVRRTPSAMGLISEFFRRRPGVRRSLSPAHPILAHGERSEWFVAGHEDCLYSCGSGTPFEKLLQVGGKVVFFNVPFIYFTFFHYLEDRLRSKLNFPLYHEPAFDVPVFDASGHRRVVKTFVFAKAAIARRRFGVLEEWLRRRGVIRSTRVGASTLVAVDLEDVMAVVEEMTKQNLFFYDSNNVASAGDKQ